jgi:hypothetical protein
MWILGLLDRWIVGLLDCWIVVGSGVRVKSRKVKIMKDKVKSKSGVDLRKITAISV